MNLISILLITTAVLCLLTGFLSLVGSSKNERGRMAWFFAMSLGCAMWTAGIGVFRVLPLTSGETLTWALYGIYISSLFLAVATLGYAAWRYTIGKVLVILCTIGGIFLAAVFLHDPGLLYTDITLSNAGNSVNLYWGWYYIAYCLFYIITDSGFVVAQFLNAKRERRVNARKGNYLLFFGFLAAGSLAVIFDLIIPPYDYSLIWIGPLSLSVVMIMFFYATLKYHLIRMSSRWLQVFAYGVIASIGVIIYMLTFYLIFTSLFKASEPSASVLVLNFLMIVIILMLMPVINEISSSIKSMISVGQVDIGYVIKKLNRLASKKIDLYELAGFLADHLHFTYVGFIINGHLYGSKTLSMSRDEIEQIVKMKSTSQKGAWQVPTKTVQKTLDEMNLKAVAELYNAKGKPFGQIIVGKPLGKATMEHRDLVQLEMIINLVASVIDSSKHLRA